MGIISEGKEKYSIVNKRVERSPNQINEKLQYLAWIFKMKKLRNFVIYSAGDKRK